jgi:hypothetical protein
MATAGQSTGSCECAKCGLVAYKWPAATSASQTTTTVAKQTQARRRDDGAGMSAL